MAHLISPPSRARAHTHRQHTNRWKITLLLYIKTRSPLWNSPHSISRLCCKYHINSQNASPVSCPDWPNLQHLIPLSSGEIGARIVYRGLTNRFHFWLPTDNIATPPLCWRCLSPERREREPTWRSFDSFVVAIAASHATSAVTDSFLEILRRVQALCPNIEINRTFVWRTVRAALSTFVLFAQNPQRRWQFRSVTGGVSLFLKGVLVGVSENLSEEMFRR